jgi:hypothetical protein
MYEHTKEVEFKKMIDMPKTYNGPALNFMDPELAKKIREVEARTKKQLEWRGDEDLEVLALMFTKLLTAPSGIVINEDTPSQPIHPEKEDKIPPKPEENKN